MTSTPVNVQGFVSNTMYGTSHIQGNESKGDFGKIFESQKNSVENATEVKTPDDDVQEQRTVDKAKNGEKVNEAVNKAEEQKENSGVQENTQAQSDKSSTHKDMEENGLSEDELQKVAEVLQGAVVDVKELLMQELQLSSEELNQLMQDMNLTDADLLQMGNVKALILQATGTQDMMALLTDEGLYAQMKMMEAQFADIMKRVQDALQMNPEDVNMAMEQLDDSLNVKGDEMLQNVSAQTAEEMAVQGQKVDEQETPKGEQNPTQGNDAGNFMAQPQVSGQENVQSAATPQTGFATVDPQSIMNQIMDYMKIQMNSESTQLEMQLHPESLGTLQIRISAKEGIMTAQFTTASEAVKGVLESQMVQLQQQFDQQNIKVEAIEINVQTHAFESALEQGNERQTTEDENKKNRTRRIDLSRLEEAEEITEEDRVVAEMMAANGNSVDYLA